MGLVNIFH